jgi:hypothetical protein
MHGGMLQIGMLGHNVTMHGKHMVSLAEEETSSVASQ